MRLHNTLSDLSTGAKILLALLLPLMMMVILITTLSLLALFSPQLNMANPTAMRAITWMQDIVVFILPVGVISTLLSNNTTRYLHLARAPRGIDLLLVAAVALLSLPFMNGFIALNEGVELPSSLHALEQYMQQQEAVAAQMMEQLLSTRGFWGVVGNYLLIAMMAGLCEELYFRGVLQRVIAGGRRPIVAIWITATLFSAVHFQFYGFLPRLLLGALFGYYVVWSGNLWIAIFAHIFNNALTLTIHYALEADSRWEAIEMWGRGREGIWLALVSLVATVGLLAYLRRRLKRSPR